MQTLRGGGKFHNRKAKLKQNGPSGIKHAIKP